MEGRRREREDRKKDKAQEEGGDLADEVAKYSDMGKYHMT